MQGWLQRMAQGDPAPLEALYNRYGGAMYSAALEILKDPEAAADAVAEAFARLWKEAGVWESEPGNLFGKLGILVRFQAQDRLRSAGYRNRRQEWGKVENPDLLGASAELAPGEKLPASERGMRVRASLDGLRPGARELLKAMLFEGEICSQSAARLKKSREEIAALCLEALETLRDRWKGWAG